MTTALAPPANEFNGSATRAYSATGDSYGGATGGTALFSMPTFSPPFGNGEDDFYVRQPNGSFLDLGPNNPPALGAQGPTGGSVTDAEQAATADFSHFAWETSSSKWPLDETSAGRPSVYEYTAFGSIEPLLVGVSGGEGAHDLISVCGTKLGAASASSRPGMMSADGRTVFFSALANGSSACAGGSGVNAGVPVPVDELFARVDGESVEAHTVAISEPSPSECGSGSGAGEVACRSAAGKPAGGLFEGASSDGTKAFFTSTQQLTDSASEDHSADSAVTGCSATTGAGGCNLYEYDTNMPAGQNLIDVSADDSSGGGPRVQGVMAFSPDGTHIYFVAKGVLTPDVNDRGQEAQDGANNLYMFERRCAGGEPTCASPEQRTVFITTLPSSDEFNWKEGPGDPANVTPEGRYLLFPSHGALTADDTSASAASQVFRYDAVTNTLIRISVGNNGFDDNGNRSTATPCEVGNECSEEARIVVVRSSVRSDPSMSDNGQFVFFESPVGLTPRALNDVQIMTHNGLPVYAQNVYEWREGHVYLISSGRDVSVNQAAIPSCGETFSSVCLLGTDESGKDVFFTTTDQLVPTDTDTEIDIYDARVCEPESGNPCISSPPPPQPPCDEEACHGVPAATPAVPSGPTLTFNGQGNLAPAAAVKPKPLTRAQKLADALKVCKRDKKKAKRKQCEASAHKKYGAKTKTKKSSHGKRSK